MSTSSLESVDGFISSEGSRMKDRAVAAVTYISCPCSGKSGTLSEHRVL